MREDQGASEDIHPDHDGLFVGSIEIHPDQGTEDEWRDRLQQADHHHLHGGTGQLIDEP